MDYIKIPVEQPVNYHLTGKFEALTDDWKHSLLLLSDYELFVITRGILYLEYNQRQYTVTEGEMLLLPPVAPPHNIRKGYESSACSFYWMHFDTNEYTSFHPSEDSYLTIPEYARLASPEKIVILMKQLQDMLRAGASKNTLNYMTTSILCQVRDDINFSTESSPTDASDSSIRKNRKQLYGDIVDYINHNINSKITVRQVAEHFGYNEKYLSHMFCKISGQTIKQFILQKKAEAASFFLTDTNLSIEEISDKLGYSDSHNFARSYKSQTGLAPTEYRNAFSKRILNH
ncbi:MAG: AraC family transcriptional regulator [Lachnospiraceae bacterium]|nr:AraC family transcriptional regulator [Lachnospiraceae bacterium]